MNITRAVFYGQLFVCLLFMDSRPVTNKGTGCNASRRTLLTVKGLSNRRSYIIWSTFGFGVSYPLFVHTTQKFKQSYRSTLSAKKKNWSYWTDLVSLLTLDQFETFDIYNVPICWKLIRNIRIQIFLLPMLWCFKQWAGNTCILTETSDTDNGQYMAKKSLILDQITTFQRVLNM